MTYLWKTCTKLEGAPEINNLPATTKEECLFAFLLKIFVQSEANSTEDKDKDVNDAEKSEQDDNKKEELRLRKRVINYLKVCNIKMNIAIFLNYSL